MIYTGRASLHTSITLTLHLGRVKTAYTSCKESFFFGRARPLCSTKKSFRLCIRFSLIQGQKLLKFYFCGTTLIAGLRRPLNCVLTYTSPW